MKPIGNTASVRKYYCKHRDEVIKHKTLQACRQEGRIPRISTLRKHNMQWKDVLDAFAAWQATKSAGDRERRKRESRLHALIQAT